MPNTHAAYLADLDPEIGAQMFRVAQKMAEVLRKSGLKCKGVNLFLADGKAAMQDVFHVHLHVFPRFKGGGFGLTLPDDYFTKPPRSKLESAAESIRQSNKALQQMWSNRTAELCRPPEKIRRYIDNVTMWMDLHTIERMR